MMSKFSGLVLLVFGLMLSFQAPVKAQESRSYYPLKVGNKWTYQIESDTIAKGTAKLTNQIAKIEKIDEVPLSRLETTAKGKIVASEHLSINDKGIFRNRYNGIEVTPPICMLKFPVKKGSSWKTESNVGDEKLKVSCKSDEEEIEVPAGKFKTIKVIMDAEVTGAGIIVSTTYWFAQGVGVVKQHAVFDPARKV